MGPEVNMTRAGCLCYNESDLKRRHFIRVGTLSLLGISLSQYLELKDLMAAPGALGKAGKAQACILLWLEGGPSQVDTWDPKPNSAFKPISTNVAGIQISELFPRLAKRMDKFSIIRSVHGEVTNHPQGTMYALTAHKPNPAMQFPSLGSIITKEMGGRNNVPPYVISPQWEQEPQYQRYFEGAFLGPAYNPMIVSDPSKPGFQVADLTLPKTISVARLEDRRSFLKIWDRYYREKVEAADCAGMDGFETQALRMILTPGVRDAFDLTKESPKTKDAYGRDSVGQSLLLARRLVEAGSRFVTAAGFHFNEWDSHSKNDEAHRDKLSPRLDRSLSVLVEDLDQRGLLESTVIVVMGEFGRTPHHNQSMGRDHWPNCYSVLLGGGGLRAGQVVGSSDERGAEVAEREVSVGDIFATVYKAFGIDWAKEYMHPIGRPIKIANSFGDKTASPVKELV